MRKEYIAVACALLSLTACSTIPPRFVSRGHHPVIDRDGVAYLLTDVCIQYDALGVDDDRFLGNDSRTIASSMTETISEYLSKNGIKVNSRQEPLVCGAIHNAGNTPEQFSSNYDSPIVTTSQPFEVSNELSSNTQYLTALRNISSYAFQHAGNKSNNIFSGARPYEVSIADFKASAKFLMDKSGQYNLLYVGVTGIRESQGKRTLKAAVASALSAGIATAGAVTQQQISPLHMTPDGKLYKSGVVYTYPVFYPIPGVSGKQVVAGLIDLRSGELVWNNELDSSVITNTNSIDLLLFDVAHKRTTQWSPPGERPHN